MIDRRQIMTGGVLGSVMGALGAESAAASPQSGAASPDQAVERSLERLARSVDDLKQSVVRQREFPEIAVIRDQQKQYLRTNGKMPDFMEVGIDIWFNAHDWHVRWQQPMNLGRDPLGRLTLVLSGTVIVMRPDAAPLFVGQPFDNR